MTNSNDADKRPRIYVHSATSDQEIEVTVQESEGERTDDVKETAEEMYEMAKQEVEDDDEVSKSYE
ncbi:hypothetical protein HCTV5_86 [Halovirus HCTV-5]|uniref:hypothetical protein n=1 Tax=Halovirus HCTV-5 TaxID=1273748 RepID=UPI000334872A|nr:hypothetical protein M200_gp139 [Halovirus HCTV-5]AGM11695.1 hypothetical protein HCTV5_86 [Halovirus HCTV-5]